MTICLGRGMRSPALSAAALQLQTVNLARVRARPARAAQRRVGAACARPCASAPPPPRAVAPSVPVSPAEHLR